MDSIYTLKRKEPRVKLCTRVAVTISDGGGLTTSVETRTVDVSRNGASVRIDAPVSVGAVVRVAAIGYAFATRAVVRSVVPDRAEGGYLVGIEYLDEKNPIVGGPRVSEPAAACKSTA